MATQRSTPTCIAFIKTVLNTSHSDINYKFLCALWWCINLTTKIVARHATYTLFGQSSFILCYLKEIVVYLCLKRKSYDIDRCVWKEAIEQSFVFVTVNIYITSPKTSKSHDFPSGLPQASINKVRHRRYFINLWGMTHMFACPHSVLPHNSRLGVVVSWPGHDGCLQIAISPLQPASCLHILINCDYFIRNLLQTPRFAH